MNPQASLVNFLHQVPVHHFWVCEHCPKFSAAKNMQVWRYFSAKSTEHTICSTKFSQQKLDIETSLGSVQQLTIYELLWFSVQFSRSWHRGHPCPVAGTSTYHGNIRRIRYPLFCRTFRLFWSSPTIDDDYLGEKLTDLSKTLLTMVLLLLVGRVLQMWKEKNSFQARRGWCVRYPPPNARNRCASCQLTTTG